MERRLFQDGGALYSIQLQGVLDQDWADQYGNLRVLTSHSEDAKQPTITTVVGEIVDQAALTGFLNLVHDLGLPLLSVTYLGRV